jgi:hypothetical protein
LVSGVHAASLRAVNYAGTLEIAGTRAVYFAFDKERGRRFSLEWQRNELELPLEIVDAPYRDLVPPLLRYTRELTRDDETLVVLVMPEVVVAGWRRLLHHQRAPYMKRLLVFEPHVVLNECPLPDHRLSRTRSPDRLR